MQIDSVSPENLHGLWGVLGHTFVYHNRGCVNLNTYDTAAPVNRMVTDHFEEMARAN